jgi:murein DD-endopeptidase MepM/ murein hydrolase activator NlpD
MRDYTSVIPKSGITMQKTGFILIAGFLIAGLLPCHSAPARKRNISVGEARREVGVVAAYQQFPSDYRIDRLGSLQVDDEYYHIFTCYLQKRRKWRALVFANSGSYLGFYETIDQPVELGKNCLIYPGSDYSAEFGDDEEGEFDHGTAYKVLFGLEGPPDEVKFEEKTYSFVSSPTRVRPDHPGYRFIQVADRVVDAINRSRYKQVRDDFSKRSLNRVSEQQTVEILSNVREKLGRIDRVGSPWVQSADTAVLPVTFERAVAGLKLTLTKEDKIAGMWVLPFKSAFPDIGKNQVTMTLPFEGQWRLLWGGDDRDQTKYFGSRVSHYALEFVIASRFGKTYRDKGRWNQNYFAFGKSVRAPAAGTVVAVINGVPDNRPHSPNPFDRLGNAIMIEHATNEYSVVGHLMLDSIVVRVGDEVQARQHIAHCGNSGDSSQPSLYFHLQDSPEILSGSGYRTVFSNLYIKKGGQTEIAAEYSPVRGEFVQQRSMPKESEPAGQGREAVVARQ